MTSHVTTNWIFPVCILQLCLIQAARFTDPNLSLQAVITKAAFLPILRTAQPTACPAAGMDFPVTQTALYPHLGLPTWTPPLAMAFHLRSVECFHSFNWEPEPNRLGTWGKKGRNCQIRTIKRSLHEPHDSVLQISFPFFLFHPRTGYFKSCGW